MDRHLDPRLRRALLDWLAPTLILVIEIVDLSGHRPAEDTYPAPAWRHVVFLTTAVVLLGVRRFAPVLAPTLATVVVSWWVTLWPAGAQGPFEGFVVLVGAAYSLGSARPRRGPVVGVLVLAAWFVAGLIQGIVGGRAGDVAPIMVWLTAAFTVGYLIRRRTDEASVAVESARVLASEQDRRTERAIEDERARIARELHDVVAHSLSVIVVQAGAERRTNSDDSAQAVLASIERAGRDALVDLRRLLGLLRRTDEPLSLAPQPGLAQLDELVANARDAGLHVELDLGGSTAPLPPGLDLTAYRIVQEALTNTLKHANARSVRVAVVLGRNQLDVQVSDDGQPGSTTNLATNLEGAGQGLIGMRERVKIFGGTIDAGAEPTGGWTVHARLPVAAGSTS